MSSVIDSLNGSPSYILWKRFSTYVDGGGNTQYRCVLRFVVGEWSAALVAGGKHKYIASSKALRRYHAFADKVGMMIEHDYDVAELYQPTLDQLKLYALADKEYLNAFGK